VTFGVMLVVGGDIARGLDDCFEAVTETCRPSKGGRTKLSQSSSGVARSAGAVEIDHGLGWRRRLPAARDFGVGTRRRGGQWASRDRRYSAEKILQRRARRSIRRELGQGRRMTFDVDNACVPSGVLEIEAVAM